MMFLRVGLSGLEPLTSALSGRATVPAGAMFAHARGPRTFSDGAGSRVPLSPTSSPTRVSTPCSQRPGAVLAERCCRTRETAVDNHDHTEQAGRCCTLLLQCVALGG